MWTVAGDKSKDGRKRYFHIDENASSEQIYALLDEVCLIRWRG